jgi:hypothetical protein
MLSMRDHAVEQEIRKDAQAQAEHHRMLKLACGKKPSWMAMIYRRLLASLGERLVAWGSRMQSQSKGVPERGCRAYVS